MRILMVGNGGREHTLLWKLKADSPSAEFFATQPNGGMAALAEGVEIAPGDTEALAGWAAARSIDLTVVGPEAPLAAGIADRFRNKGLPVFGPSAAAARIESSKSYAKELMRGAGVPTADFRVFRELAAAQDYIREQGAPIVIKASGLAAGKGAIVCDREEEALQAVREMLEDFRFGEAGREVVVEECMRGEELSVFVLTDGREFLTLLPSQDHKRVGEGDTGPNTGGLGAYAPVSLVNPGLMQEVEERVLLPTLRALESDGSAFQGLLYAGLMLTHEGPKVVEFNCRFGDPETQAILPLLASSLLEPMATIAEGGSVSDLTARWHSGGAVTTVLASQGYPGSYEKGKPIHLPPSLADDPNLFVFQAGTRSSGDGLVTSGGRVLAVTGIGDSLADASRKSLVGADAVEFEGKYFRTDIGWREFARDEAGRP
ncbi:MAG: phosphoribosylamine--glycine ligase [Gemmatimonadetes bacterium]|nr:phosphoribosylamine--glycine ligase [Gemmatimonadota bacterium]